MVGMLVKIKIYITFYPNVKKFFQFKKTGF